MKATLTPEKLMAEAIDAFNSRDIERFLAVMDSDVEARPLLAELAGTPYRGHSGLRRWWEEALESWEYQAIRLDSVEADGDQALALISLVGRGKLSGVEFEMQWAMVFRLHNGLCTYFRIYADREEARRAAGLS